LTGFVDAGAKSLKEIWDGTDKLAYLCGQLEETKEEKRHWQAFVVFKVRQRPTGVRKLFPGWHHERARDQAKSRDYAMKTDSRVEDPVEFGVFVTAGKTPTLELIKKKIQDGATEKSLWEDHFGTMVRHHRGIKRGREMLRAARPSKRYKTTDYPQFKTLVFDDQHSIVLWGKPGIGKTKFALAHFENPLFVSHKDQLKDFDDHDGIVFDDMNFQGNEDGKGKWPRHAQIHLADREEDRAIDVKHDFATIPWGTKKIFTTNVQDGAIFDLADGAISRRLTVIELRGHKY